jgi:UPF0755 protein
LNVRTVAALVLLLLLSAAGAVTWLWQDFKRELSTPMQLSAPDTLVVTPGMSLRRVAAELKRRGWIEQPLYLVIAGRLQGKSRAIKAGEFSVPPGTTPQELLDRLVAGRVLQHTLTIVEGWTLRQILEAVRNHPTLVQTLDTADPRRVMATIGYPGYFAEGRFFPDTYHFPAGTTDVEFLRRAVQRMHRVLEEEWAQRDVGLPYASAYEALIVASLVERETAVPAERQQIAGVFVRRLRKNMKLQTDPTVIYAMGEKFDGNIRRRDLDIDSPFNTYRYAGLPPTPIGSPGRAAIHAALHPAPGEALYFVSRGDGSHEFTASLEAHNRAVRKYQLRKRP